MAERTNAQMSGDILFELMLIRLVSRRGSSLDARAETWVLRANVSSLFPQVFFLFSYKSAIHRNCRCSHFGRCWEIKLLANIVLSILCNFQMKHPWKLYVAFYRESVVWVCGTKTTRSRDTTIVLKPKIEKRYKLLMLFLKSRYTEFLASIKYSHICYRT